MTEQVSEQRSRPFRLVRDHDVTGVSGVGVVADGVVWPDGSVSIRWRGDRPSVVHWGSLVDAVAVHGHNGATRMVFATEAGRLARIAEAHGQEVREVGLTSGDCVECGWPWPCPTYV